MWAGRTVRELDDLEQLDAHTEGEDHLALPRDLKHLPLVEIAKRGADKRLAILASIIARE